jgi:uncharacterized protein (TIGR03437 family)
MVRSHPVRLPAIGLFCCGVALADINLSPGTANIAAAGGQSSLQVINTVSTSTWTAVSSEPSWLTITSGSADLLPKPLLPVSVMIGGIPATEITYTGSAPALTAGAFQVNVKIPDDVPWGQIPVVLKVGDAISQSGLTVSVR